MLGETRPITAAEQRHLLSQYDGGIAYLDSQIGQLLGTLKELGLYDDTLIVITSDHGEALGEKNLVGHSITSLYQDQVHVPLLMRYPNGQRTGESNMLVSHVDIMPTILGVLGYAAPAGVQGRMINDAAAPDRQVYSEAYGGPLTVITGHHRFRGVKRAVFSGSSKLIVWTNGSPELYDLASDPEETRNLYGRGESAALETRLAAWRAQASAERSPAPVRTRPNLDNLKSLGYVQ